MREYEYGGLTAVTSSSFMSASASGGMAVMNVPGRSVVDSSDRTAVGASRGFDSGVTVRGILTRKDALLTFSSLSKPHPDHDVELAQDEGHRVDVRELER